MSRLEGFDIAALARETITFLIEKGIPATPANYEIWISHHAGVYPDLSREIQTRVAGGDAFTDEVSCELFERFFAGSRLNTHVAEATEGVARELAGAVASLREAGQHSGSYALELQSAVKKFEGGIDPAALPDVLRALVAATRETNDRNLHLSTQMEASARQVETLQARLETVKLEALTDGLTGLANRRYFDDALREACKDPSTASERLCLLMCDVDHFKRFNDTWGHLIGDHVLRFIANELRKHAGEEFLAARYGGEEFALIMPDTTLVGAHKVAVAIGQAIRSKRLTRKSTGEIIGAVTISMGLAQSRAGETVQSLIARADACLYASKAAGRDRITTDAEMKQSSAA